MNRIDFICDCDCTDTKMHSPILSVIYWYSELVRLYPLYSLLSVYLVKQNGDCLLTFVLCFFNYLLSKTDNYIN